MIVRAGGATGGSVRARASCTCMRLRNSTSSETLRWCTTVGAEGTRGSAYFVKSWWSELRPPSVSPPASAAGGTEHRPKKPPKNPQKNIEPGLQSVSTPTTRTTIGNTRPQSNVAWANPRAPSLFSDNTHPNPRPLSLLSVAGILLKLYLELLFINAALKQKKISNRRHQEGYTSKLSEVEVPRV